MGSDAGRRAHGGCRSVALMLALGLVGAIPCPAQEDVRFDQISLEAGLSQSSVLCAFEDRRGFLWVGTQAGLNLYDGRRITVLSTAGAAGRALSNDEVMAVAETPDGGIWVGTKGGLDRVDPRTGDVERVPLDASDPEGPDVGSVATLTVDRRGWLWVGTRSGLLRVNPTTRRCERVDLPGERALAVSSILDGAGGELWLGTSDSTLLRFDPAGGSLARFELPPELKATGADAEHLFWTSLVASSSEELLVGFCSSGLFRFNRAEGRFAPLDPELNRLLRSHRRLVTSMARDDAGDLWVCTYDGGLVRVPADGSSFRVYSSHGGEDGYVPSSHFFSVHCDRAGVVWVGSLDAGLLRVRRTKIARFDHDPRESFGLSGRVALSVLEEPGGVVWVGLMDGLDRLDPVRRTRLSFREVVCDGRRETLRNVFFLDRDEGGRVLVGGYPFGLVRLDPERGSCERLGTTRMVSSAARAADGSLWVAGLTEGLVRLDPASGRETRLDPTSVRGLELGERLPAEVLVSADGALWVGTGDGLFRVEPGLGAATVYSATTLGLRSAEILELFQASDGALWVGTATGLARQDPASGRFEAVTRRDGLPDDLVCAILEARDGALWLGTNNGLCRFDPRTRAFRTFDTGDGLPSRELNQGQAWAGASGRLYFGTTSGVAVVDPERVVDSAYEPPVAITSFAYGDVVVDRPLGWPDDDRRRLSYAQRDVTFTFAGLDLACPERVDVQVRLSGYDARFKSAGTDRTVSYTNLPGGAYELEARSTNCDGRLSRRVARLRFDVEPPFWRRWWVRVVGVLAGAGLVVAVYRLRVAQVERQRDSLRREVEARTAELERLATSDSLTGVHNRRHFFVMAEQELNRARRRLRPTALLMLDLDHFKAVNDRFGHAVGDAALRAVADTCAATLRAGDVVGRLGGEEFAVVLHEVELERARSVAERLRAAVEALRVASESGDVALAVSIGVAAWRGPEESLEALLRRADAALYRAKAAGRNRVVVAEE